VACSCEHGNELSGSIGREDLLHKYEETVSSLGWLCTMELVVSGLVS
jgi:hypothetical protein